jgi:DNA-binding MarR family transcriptional regulator
LSSGALTALVDRLERTGYVERRPDPADRRSSVVLPVPEGLEEAGCHLVPVATDLLEKTAEFTNEERAAVGKYLEAATEIFRRHAWV